VIVVVAISAAAVVLWLTVLPTTGQQQPAAAGGFPAYSPPRVMDGRPDLNGVWQALVTANVDLEDHEAQSGPHPELLGAYGGWPAGQGVVEGGEIPYKPEAVAKKQQNVANRMKVDVHEDTTWHDVGDPELKCYMPGVPRATYMPFPLQIVQGTADSILISYEFASATRIVRMNWKGEAPTDSWMGWSRGS
jgi:hypothetical protein